MALVDLKSNLSTAFKTSPVDFIDDTSSGAKGFVENFTNPNESKFLGIQGTNYTYPDTVIGARLMKPNKSTNSFPGPQNFFNNDSSGAQGFSLFNKIGNSKYLGIEDGVYNYPMAVLDGRLMRPKDAATFPGPQNYFDNDSSGAQGFNLKFTNPNESKFIGITGKQYFYPSTVIGGRLMKPNQSGAFPGPQNFFNNDSSGAKGFSITNNIVNSKYLGISNTTYTYPNTVVGNRLMQPKDSATFPGPQNFFNNDSSGAQGFNLKFTNPNESKFIGISGNQYTYPNTVVGGRLMNPAGSSKYPGPQNFIIDENSGANGFTLNFTSPNESKFIGIQNSLYTYPNTVVGGRLMKPNKSTNAYPGPQNYFNDDRWGSKGFTLNFGTENDSKFLGIEGRQFTFPKTVLPIHKNSVREVPLGNSKYNQGTATLENQLGTGSPFKYVRDKFVTTTKIFSSQGYNEKAKYTNYVRVADSGPELSLLYKKGTEQNSPSAIEEQYKKFNLREEAFNFQYIDHPLILRGIQRKGKEKPNRWGVDALVNFDDGLIQGGITTAVERAANDVARIAKWMATPKGLLWIVKQVGLGLTNPKVETNPLTPGPLGRQTRIHSGLTSLLSVAGTPFGLHFTRHSLPWVNQLANYEEVLKVKSRLFFKDRFRYTYTLAGNANRLIQLVNEYQTNPINSEMALTFSGEASRLLSGLAGPQSVYGIGVTSIRRAVETATRDKILEDQNKSNPFSRNYGYAKNLAPASTGVNSSYSGDKGYERDVKVFRIQRPNLFQLAVGLFDNRNKPAEMGRTVENPKTFDSFTVINNVYNPTLPTSKEVTDGDKTSKDLIDSKNYSTKLAAGALRANTKHTLDPNKDEDKIDNKKWDDTTRTGPFEGFGAEFKSLKQRLEDNKNLKFVSDQKEYAYGLLRANTNNDFDASSDNADPKISQLNADDFDRVIQLTPDSDKIFFAPLADRIHEVFKNETTPGATINNSEVDISTNEGRETVYKENNSIGATVNEYATLAYHLIPKDKGSRPNFTKDFRTELESSTAHFSGQHDDSTYYDEYNLEKKYGFGKQGSTRLGSKITQRGKASFLVTTDPGQSDKFIDVASAEAVSRYAIANHDEFRGDRINAINVPKKTNGIVVTSGADSEIYPKGVRDFVRLIFEDPDSGPAVAGKDKRYTVMIFRGTITGLSDSFSPGWNAITVMGRPDSAYLYSSFERNLSFTFTVAATSRQEMLPIWRKLNYLAGYTMPDFNSAGSKPSGPMLRLTLGDLFDRCPGFLNSLSYTIPDDATWDIADDEDKEAYMAKQLPTVVEVSIDFKVIGDYRPQQHGKAYYLGSWLLDSEDNQKFASDLEEENKAIKKRQEELDSEQTP